MIQLKCQQINSYYDFSCQLILILSNAQIFIWQKKYLDQSKVGKYIFLTIELKGSYFRYILALHLLNLVAMVATVVPSKSVQWKINLKICF